MNIDQAIKQARKQVLVNNNSKIIEKALNLLDYEGVEVYNYSLAHFDTKSVNKSVIRFIEINLK